MKIGIAGLIHETNTFSVMPTPIERFIQQDGFYPEMRVGDEIYKFSEGRYNIATSGFLSLADRLNFEIAPLLWCGAEPSRPVSEDTFDKLVEDIIEQLKRAMPLDGLFLDLHGAMVYGDLQDGEVELMRRLRPVVGDIPMVASYDLHGNIDPECFNLATAMIGYRTYPHVDGFENGERCAHLMAYLVNGGEIYGSFRQSPFLMPSTTQPTTKNPAKAMYEFLGQLENEPGILSATIMEGFPACDLPHTGPSIFAYAATKDAADACVEKLYDYILDHEADFVCDLLQWDEAVKLAMENVADGIRPVILADIQDNAGGGSPSDTVWLLEALIKNKAQNAVNGVIYDPETAAAAHRAGVGQEIKISLGGKSVDGQQPYQGKCKVIQLHDGDFQGAGPMLKGRTLNLGKMAHLLVEGVHVVVSTGRMQAMDKTLFQVVGVEPAEMDILALKSANHYRAHFGPIAGNIINVEAPSMIIEDPSKIPYTRLREGVRLKGLGPEFHK